MQSTFALMYSLTAVICGFSSAVLGGVLCDKFGQGKPMFKSQVCIIGNLIAMPMFLICVLSGKFWLSMAMVAGKYLFGEPWKSPAITMMQNTVSPKKFGNIVSAYQFFYIMAGCCGTILFGSLVNFFNCSNNPAMIGKILAGFCTFAYLTASSAFYMAGRHYTSITTKTKFSLFKQKNVELA